jgi:hypothetical protein
MSTCQLNVSQQYVNPAYLLASHKVSTLAAAAGIRIEVLDWTGNRPIILYANETTIHLLTGFGPDSGG